MPKTRRGKIWLFTALAYVVFAVFVWFLGGWLALQGTDLWVMRFGLWGLGLVTAGLLVWFFTGSESGDGPGAAAGGGGDDLDTTLAAATAHLASARAAGARPLHSLPMIVFLGPEGSAKTTVIAHSGLEPELLAGAVFQGDHIGPTPSVNLWYTHQTVLLEAGGKLGSDPGRWGRLVRRIRPRTLKATLTGRPQASRAAVVCFSCEELLKPGSAQAVPAAARTLRTLLFRLAQGSGVQLPVYVLFTKADRIPYFAEFTGRLSRDEAQQVLGVTQRWPGRATAGPYADREFQRLNVAIDRLMSSLAATRLDLLARELDVERQSGLYEFPRELRKIVPGTIQFLVDLCRPSQLEIGPVLRGFYFTGVRAVVVSDAAPVAPASGSSPAGPGRIAATQAFNPASYEPAAAALGPVSPTARKMPQWLFLSTLFREVLLRDRAPGAVAQSARNVALLRRAGLAAAVALCVIGGLWSTVQYVKNGRAISAARELAVVIPSGTDLPTVETLTRLETLRAHLERLSTWRRWWFYKGKGLYPELRQIYQERFNSILLGPARVSILKSLDSLPDAPNATAQYGRAYDLLKAYLMTTSQPDKLTARFVVPVLTERLINGREFGPERTELAQRQFDFYASRLCHSAACGTDPEVPAVVRTRRFLGQFTGADRVYKLMVSEVSAKNPAIQFTRRFPTAAGLVADGYEIPGAFTERGWAGMQDALKHVDRFFQTDDWVLGDQQGGGLDRAKLVGDLRATYVADYIRSWLAFLTAASVVQYQNPKDAARKLSQLGGNQSPVLQLLSLVAQNTKVDAATVGAAFQPVHVVMPPTVTDRFVVEANQPYIGALNALQAVVEQTATAGAPDGLAPQTLDAARSAKAAVGQIALKFSVTGEAAAVGVRVKSLLEEPIDRVERLMGRLPFAALNERGAAFCRSFGAILGKYPIKPDASVEATLSEVAGVFEPNNGALWRFYNEGLQNVMVKQGVQYGPKSGVGVSPTPAFVRFFNRLAAVTEALWPSGATQPQFDFTLKLLPAEGVPAAAFSMDGQVRRFTRTFGAAQRFSWVGAGARDVRLSGEVRGRDETLLGYDGTWALFKLLQRARWGTIGVTSIVRWVVPVQGQSVGLEAELNLGAARPILKGDYFVGMSCVSQVVK